METWLRDILLFSGGAIAGVIVMALLAFTSDRN